VPPLALPYGRPCSSCYDKKAIVPEIQIEQDESEQRGNFLNVDKSFDFTDITKLEKKSVRSLLTCSATTVNFSVSSSKVTERTAVLN